MLHSVVREDLLSRWHLNRDLSEEIEESWGDTRKTFQIEAIKAESKKELGEPEFQRFGINACLCTWTTRQQGECFQDGKAPRRLGRQIPKAPKAVGRDLYPTA